MSSEIGKKEDIGEPKKPFFVRHFYNEQFFHYVWTGGLFTFLNIFLVWLFIEVLHIPTLISSVTVIGGLFVIRFLVYRWLKVM